MGEQQHRQRIIIVSALATGIGCMGDSALYLILPIHYDKLQLSVIWISVLLSVNRLIRIFLYSPILAFVRTSEPRTIMTTALCLATLTTFSYTLIHHEYLWLAARILWGIAFCMLRLTAVYYATRYAEKNVWLGISNALQETVQCIGIIAGAYLFRTAGFFWTFFVLAALTATASLFLRDLPSHDIAAQEQTSYSLLSSLRNMTASDASIFIIALALDGIMLVGVGLWLKPFITSFDNLLITTAFILATRRFFGITLSLLSGRLADIVDIRIVFLGGLVLVVAGLAILAGNGLATGLIVAVIGGTIVTTLLPKILLRLHGQSALTVTASFVFWRDVGAAIGGLLGIWVMGNELLRLSFTAMTSIALLSSMVYYGIRLYRFAPKQAKTLYDLFR